MVGFTNESLGHSIKKRRIKRYPELFGNIDDYEYYHASSGTSKALYQDFEYSYRGELAITSKNLIFIHQKMGFEIDLGELAFVKFYSDGISIQHEDKAYTVLVECPRYFMAVLNMVRETYKKETE